ncbi:hypothetical protein Y046_5273 [Burkholderia pseudomallei MSHR2990]|nr:hypothetical protein Y046_5273 [Burkholderia pseudomallei MSHR2990]
MPLGRAARAKSMLPRARVDPCQYQSRHVGFSRCEVNFFECLPK